MIPPTSVRLAQNFVATLKSFSAIKLTSPTPVAGCFLSCSYGILLPLPLQLQVHLLTLKLHRLVVLVFGMDHLLLVLLLFVHQL